MREFHFDPIKMRKKFGRAMAAKGWNHNGLAARCDISASLLSKVLKGERSSIKTISAIAKKLDVPLDSILKDEEVVA